MRLPSDRVRLFVLGFTIVLLVTGVWGASTSTPAFSPYNPEWDGASELHSEANAVGSSPTVVTDTADYESLSASETLSLILSPDQRYTDSEVRTLETFVRDGGTLVVAEDFGPHSNPLLRQLGVATRVDGGLVRDERSYHRSPNITVATNVTESNLTGNTSRLTLNYGTALRPNGARVLVETSPYAYIDEDRNASLDTTEAMQEYPVVTTEQLGDGRVVVVSDPSLFINAMIDRTGNRKFTRTLFSEHSTVVLDYSHSTPPPLLVRATLTLERSPALQGLVGFALLGLVLVVSIRLPAIRSESAKNRRATTTPVGRIWRQIMGERFDYEPPRDVGNTVGIINDEPEGEEDD